METVRLPSGLWVPATAAFGPSPIDLIKTYLVASEVFGGVYDLSDAQDWLKRADREMVLKECAGLLAERERIGADWHELDVALARRIFQEPHATKVVNLLADDRRLLSSQGLLVLAKAALQMSPSKGDRGTRPSWCPRCSPCRTFSVVLMRRATMRTRAPRLIACSARSSRAKRSTARRQKVP